MHVAAGVPQREDRITLSVRDACLAAALHQRIFAVHVAQQIWVEQCMVQRRVKHRPLLRRAAFDPDSAQSFVPALAGLLPDDIESRISSLLGLEVLAGILDRDVGDAHAHHHLVALGQPVVGKPVADIVARKVAAIARIELVGAVVGRPFGLDAGHRALFLPVPRGRRNPVDAQHEIDREDRLRIIAEGSQQFRALDLGVAHAAHRRTRLVGEPFAQI